MKIHNDTNIDKCPRAVALGYFDAVHLGHQQVVSKAVAYAKKALLESAVFTFDLSLTSLIKGKQVLQPQEKQSRLADLGVESYICPNFEELRSLTPNQFVEDILHTALCAKAVFCGSNYTFGVKKAGNIQLLKELCGKLDIKVYVVEMKELSGADISASRIRQCLEQGDMKQVTQLMGKPYSVTLPVVHGKGLGKTLGVPTINQIYLENMYMPKSGVYATRVKIFDEYYPGATGIGTRPTVNGTSITCETYIKSFTGNLYGKDIKIEFLDFLFETKKYDNLQELKACILAAAEQSEEINKQ